MKKPVVTSSMREYHYFVAHEFGAQQRDDLRAAIEAAFKGSGLKGYYADIELRQKHILEKIMERIRTTQFGIYDVTNGNPNVCLELGIAIALGKPYYIVCKKGAACPTDLQGLDRIEYESFKYLTTEIKRKIAPREIERFKQLKSAQELEQKHSELPEEVIRKHSIKLYQAEQLLHRFGSEVKDEAATNKKAWFADLSQMTHHLIYGPYEPLDEPGDYMAFFRMKIDDNSSSDYYLLLDVVGEAVVKKAIRGTDFKEPHVYQLFGLKFRTEGIYSMEYRVRNTKQQGKVWIDYVAIVKLPFLTQ
jgi:hypothetical protein